MNNSVTLNAVKESFETWYNQNVSKGNPVSITINYSDVQTLSIKAFHTITMEMVALQVKDGLSHSIPLVTIQENYNHGTTTEGEAKEGLTKKLLMRLYSFNN